MDKVHRNQSWKGQAFHTYGGSLTFRKNACVAHGIIKSELNGNEINLPYYCNKAILCYLTNFETYIKVSIELIYNHFSAEAKWLSVNNREKGTNECELTEWSVQSHSQQSG